MPNTNTFPAGPSPTPIIELTSVTGSTVSNNLIDGAGSDFQEGILLENGNNDSILSNTITLAPSSGTLHTIGIDIEYSTSGASTINIGNNHITTNNVGIGLNINATHNTDANVKVDVYGNDFHNNAIGVRYIGAGGTPGSDLGGGALGSVGGNNFRGFTSTATASAGAIVVSNVAAGATLSAQDNLFANGTTPGNVVSPNGTSVINTNGAVTGTAAFIQAAFMDLLGRNASSSEVSQQTNVFNSSSGQAGVIDGLITSQEGANFIVNNLYIQLLGRPADSMGLSFWSSMIQNGGTLEQVETGILTSPEFLARANGSNYVQDLYLVLLNRTASADELAYWNGVLSGQNGAANVAMGILTSTEYRMDFAQSIYEQDLHRSASSSELSGWANATASLQQLIQQFMAGDFSTQLSLLGIEEGILSSTEFFNNG